MTRAPLRSATLKWVVGVVVAALVVVLLFAVVFPWVDGYLNNPAL